MNGLWKVHQEILRIKVRQNGYYYKWENNLETKILEADSKMTHKDNLGSGTDGVYVLMWEPVS